jgi:hypothetical protein
MADKLAKQVCSAYEELVAAQKRYEESRKAYSMDRLLRIRRGETLEPSILLGADLEQQQRMERVAIHNRSVDDETQRARERGLLP